MRLKRSKTAAEEALTALIIQGYELRGDLLLVEPADYPTQSDKHLAALDHWRKMVLVELNNIFPTKLELCKFLQSISISSPNPTVATLNEAPWHGMVEGIYELVQALEHILDRDLQRYTDLPAKSRLYIEDIDSFRNVRDINPAQVRHILRNGYLEWLEDDIQLALEQILDVSFHKLDSPDELNDLYTANVVLNGRRTSTAFLLKGRGLRSRVLEIGDCGKNGDQLLRLCASPAELFVVQFVGEVSEAVVQDTDDKIELMRHRNKEARYCIVDGQDTARILRAYGKL